MRTVNFDLDALRSFMLGLQLGSFAKAADKVGRSPSAISAQLKKLEDQAGAVLLQKSGRSMILTQAGETLYSYAQRLLSLNDEAALAINGHVMQGVVRLGLQEDFSEHLLPGILGEFTRSHPNVEIEVCVASNQDLLRNVSSGDLDLALAWYTGTNTTHMDILGAFPLRWIQAASTCASINFTTHQPVPLVTFERTCQLRKLATDTLDAAGLRWRVVYSCTSLGGIWAAVEAGLGIAIRTEFGIPDSVMALNPSLCGLPDLPPLSLALHRAKRQPSVAVARLHELIGARVAAHMPGTSLAQTH
jgi:DNA-binding transcriptional LysR family regulator